MSSKTQKNPSIRFKGFTDAWEQRKLSAIVKLFGGYAFSSADSNSYGIPWLKIANVGKNGIDWSSASYLPDNFWLDYEDFRLFTGDYVMALTRPIISHALKIAVVDKNALLNQRVAKLIFETNEEYGFQLLQRGTVVDRIESELAGTDPPNLGSGNLKNITISITSNNNEQAKIGIFFKKLDDTIALHQRQLDSYKELKTAMLQKVFPQEGEIVPKIRFTGYSGNLEKKKMNQIFSVSILKNKENRFGKKDVLSVSREAGIVNQIEYQGRSFSSDDVSAYKKVEPGDLIYTKSPLKGAPYGIVKASDVVGIVSPLYAVYKGKNLSLGNFVSYYLSNDNIVTRYLTPIVSKGAKNTINITDSGALVGNIMIPKEEKEQQKIVGFFKQLDETIALYQQKVNDYQQLKKAMFQRMFV